MKESQTELSASAPECAPDCALDVGRREFLRNAALAVAAALVAAGGSPRAALASPLRFTEALHASEDSVTYSIPTEDGATIDREKDVILVRSLGVIYAFNLACPHQNVALRWIAADNRFQCPKHRSRYQPDGTFIEGRATRGLDRFSVRRDGETVIVDLDDLRKQNQDPDGWAAARLTLALAGGKPG